MIKKYFHTRKVRLLRDITRMMGEKDYSYLDEVEPESITQIPLVKVGVWLKLEVPFSQFSSDPFIQDVERRTNRLSQWDWRRFNEEVTGMPDIEMIEAEEEHYIFGKISAHLSDKTDHGLDIPSEPLGQLNDALFSKLLQNELCAWFNASEFQKCLIQMESLELNSENPILLAYWKFNKAVKDILEAWYKERGIAVPKSDTTEITTSSISPLSKWEDLTITFTSDESVQIRISNQKPKTLTYIDLGFKDGRKGDRPNILWGLLKGIAAYQGSLQPDNPLLDLKSRKTTEKQIWRIRKTLKTYFSLDENPIQWIQYKGYRCIFKLKLTDHFKDRLQEDHSQ